MKLRCGIFTKDKQAQAELVEAGEAGGWSAEVNPEQWEGLEVAFVDVRHGDQHRIIGELASRGAALVALVPEDDGEGVDAALASVASGDDGLTRLDDVLLLPVRQAEARSKLIRFAERWRLKGLVSAAQDIRRLADRVEEDLRVARGIQKKFIPEKYVVPGLRVTHKHYSGLKSGGDYFDVFEFEDRVNVGFFMSDSTGYGVSSALLSVMLRMAFRFGKAEPESPSRTVTRIVDEVRPLMKDGEDLSLFYGILNRNTHELSYTSCGSIRFFDGAQRANAESKAVSRTERFEGTDCKAQLSHVRRIALLTDGFAEALGGDRPLADVFNARQVAESADLINDLGYAAKGRLPADEDMPAQDCSVLVIELERPRMRLAR